MTRTAALLLLSLVLLTLICVRFAGPFRALNRSGQYNINSKLDAVIVAIEAKDEASLRNLLQDASVDLNAPGEDQAGPLIHAVACGWPQGVRMLLARGADPDRGDNMGYTPLLYVVQSKPRDSSGIVDLLIQNGADVNRCAETGQSPLRNAVQMGRGDLVQRFIRAGADVNAANDRGTTALHIAAVVDRPEMIALLLSAGADPEIMDAHGDRPLDVARQSGSDACIRRLHPPR